MIGYDRADFGDYSRDRLKELISLQKTKTNKNQLISLFEQANKEIDKYETLLYETEKMTGKETKAENRIKLLKREQPYNENITEQTIKLAEIELIQIRNELELFTQQYTPIFNRLDTLEMKVDILIDEGEPEEIDLPRFNQELSRNPFKSFLIGFKQGYKGY